MKKITIALIMVISLIAPIQTMAESVTQTGTIIEPLEQNIEQIIDEITSEPHPINSDAIQNVKEYISEYFGNLGYDNIEYQKFEYNDENNENAIRHSIPRRRMCFWHQQPMMQLLTALVKISL